MGGMKPVQVYSISKNVVSVPYCANYTSMRETLHYSDNVPCAIGDKYYSEGLATVKEKHLLIKRYTKADEFSTMTQYVALDDNLKDVLDEEIEVRTRWISEKLEYISQVHQEKLDELLQFYSLPWYKRMYRALFLKNVP